MTLEGRINDRTTCHLTAGDGAPAIYHDDAALGFPQSGERLDGLANLTGSRGRVNARIGDNVSCG